MRTHIVIAAALLSLLAACKKKEDAKDKKSTSSEKGQEAKVDLPKLTADPAMPAITPAEMPPLEAVAFGGVLRPGGGAEAEARAVRDGDGLVEARDAENARDGTEELLPVRRAPGRDVHEHGRRIEVAGAFPGFSAESEPRPRGDGLLDEAVELVKQNAG